MMEIFIDQHAQKFLHDTNKDFCATSCS